jgi:hypothetical protein
VVEFPKREKVHFRPPTANGSGKWIDDPGGTGSQIVREVNACPRCATSGRGSVGFEDGERETRDDVEMLERDVADDVSGLVVVGRVIAADELLADADGGEALVEERLVIAGGEGHGGDRRVGGGTVSAVERFERGRG